MRAARLVLLSSLAACQPRAAVETPSPAIATPSASAQAPASPPLTAAAPDEPAPRDRDYPWMSLATWNARHRAIIDISPGQRRRAQVVIVGDSITEGWDAGVWQQFFGRYHALKLGIGGDKTQQVLWRMDHGELDGLAPRVLVLLIGTNNIGDPGATPDSISRGVAKVVEETRHRLPKTVVLVLGVLPRGERPSDPVRAEIATINARLAKLDDGATVRYLDIGARFLEPDGSIRREVMRDFLHPTVKGYRMFGEAIAPSLETLIGKQAP